MLEIFSGFSLEKNVKDSFLSIEVRVARMSANADIRQGYVTLIRSKENWISSLIIMALLFYILDS